MRVLEKTERRLGEKLFLKGDRCLGPKCALTRRSYAPGAHGKSRKRAPSEYGQLLREKQKIRFLYGLRSREVETYSRQAAAKKSIFNTVLWRMLESRLDNVVFRLGLADSRRIARQVVLHRHIAVNGKVINVPSYRVKKGEVISLKQNSASLAVFGNLESKYKKYEAPRWLSLDKSKKEGMIINLPETAEVEMGGDLTKIKEFFSR